MKVVILAGGFGTRLAEQTDELPKPMVEIGSHPMLWHILKIYAHHGFNDFLIACGYRSMAIKRFFLEYRYRQGDLHIDYAADRVAPSQRAAEPWRVGLIDTGSETMTGGRIKRLEQLLEGKTFMMTYGDGVSDVPIPELLAFHRAHGKLATFTAVHPPARFGRPRFDGDAVVSFDEKPAEADDWISGGFFVLEPGVFRYITGDETIFERDPLHRLAADGELMAFKHEGYWYPMDTLRDVRILNTTWNEGQAPWKVWND